MLKPGLNQCTNAEYHADREYISSSGLKEAYKSISGYDEKYNKGVKTVFSNQGALDEGSFAHSLLLEPELVAEQYAFFDGLRKAGPEFQAFLSTVKPWQTVISKPQRIRIKALEKACRSHPAAMDILTGGISEQTICGEYMGIKIKVRFDKINVERGLILDVKTTGYSSDVHTFKHTMNGLMYELSAALYLQIAEQHYGKKFEFYFIVLSKSDLTCDVFKLSEETRNNGRMKIIKAIQKLKVARETNVWTEGAPLANINISEYEILEV